MNVVLRLGAAHNNHNAGSSGAISKEQDNNQFHDVREAIPSKAGTGYSKSHPKTEIVLPQSPRTKTETVLPQSPHTKTETVYPLPVHNKTETVYPQLPNSKTETLYPHPNSKAEIVNFHSKAETTYSHAYAEGTRSATYPSKPHSTYYQDVGEEGKSRTTVYTQHNSYPGCFGLPYQDHNYGAPPPPSPPPPASPQRTIIPLVVPQGPLTPERFNGHVEVEDVGGGPMVPDFVEQLSENVTTTVDDSVTRCICDFIHDDGYMICCDKCSVWQHIDCMDIDRNNIPDSYFCEICDPRPLDTERARQIQLKKKEFLDTLTADSSATDTDPEMETNGQMSRFDLGGQQEGGSKTKAKKRTKSGSLIIKGDGKKRKIKKEKKDIKKEKENKEHYKLPKVIGRETLAGIKSRKSKLQANKKPGLSLMITDNTQNPWDSSCSPWVDKYEEAYENDYSADIKTLLGSTRINGVHPERKTLNGQLQQAPLCHVTEVNKNRKGLEASQTLGEGEAVIEYTGRVMFKHQLDREKFFKQLNPFVLFYNKINNCEICIDATTYGNIARFIRRSCKANAEICHEVIDGQVKFFVYSTKVIPRGSEITLPYDYNYKDCAYCVECACLRSNCPVAKFFKKKLSTPVKKDKTPTKSHKSPVKSPIKLTIKSPVKKTVEEEEVEKEVPKVEETKLEVESEPAPVEEKPALRTSRRESPRIASSEQNTDPQTSQPSSADVVTDMEESSSSTASVVEKNQHKMTREERKMEAIMKAFEKMEKRQERRKEALSRIDQRKSVDCKPEEKEKCEKVKKEEKTEKPKEKEKPVKEKVQKSSKEPVPDKPVVQQPEPVEVKEEKEEIQEEIKVKEKPEVDTPAESVTPKEKPKPKSKKAKRISSRRRTRANSGNAASEPALSVDDGSNSANVPAMPPAASCPNTPTVAPPETPNSSPSFKFLKTKKHLMNEWLNEKNQDVALTSTPSDFHPKTESLQVEVEETVFVTCLPSPRNAMEHLRRNSQSSGSMMHSKGGAVSGENSIGSAKKRWLRQAMWDKPKSEDTNTTPSTPNSALGGNASPNPSLLSPGASPPGDFVTPLKKRRLARESCDMPLPSGTTTPPLVSCTTYKDGASLDESDTSGIESMSTSIEDKVTSPMSSQMELSRARRLSGAGDTVGWSVRDSIDSEVSESAGVSSESVGPSSSRLSTDLSSDSEHERTHSKVYTGNSHKEDRTCSMCSLEEICEVTNSVDNHHDQNRGQSLLRSSECDSDISEAQTVTSHNSEVCGQVLALMEVDSTDDVSRTGRFRSNSLDNVSDCTQSTRDGVVSGSRDNLRHSEVEAAVSDSTQSDRPHHLEGVVSNSTQDSEPPNVEGVVSNSTQDIRLHVEGVVSNSLDVRLPQVEGVICNSTQGLRLTQREAEVCDSVEGEELRLGEVSDSTVGMRSNVTEELVSDSTGNMRQGRGRGIVSDTSDILRVQRPSLCDSTSISEEMGSHEQPGCSSDTGQSVCVDSSTDMSATERCPETLPNIATSTGQRFSSRESNPSGSHIEQDVISASDVTTHHWDRDNVGSSSDGRSIFKVFSGVSSSSEFRKQVPVAIVESSQGVDHGSSVTSSGHASISCEIGNEMVDSSESEALANRADSEEITVEAEIVNISDSVYGSIDHDIREVEGGSLCGAGYTARDSVTEGVMFPSDNRPQDALCTSSLVNEEPGHTSSSSVTEDSNPVCRPNMSHEFEVIGSEEQKEGGEREESSLYTSSQQVEVDPMPLPTKKKVSLLEYRKRLKVKGSTSSTSSSSSSSSSTSSSYPSSSQILMSSHRLSLPSLPLFDASKSPTKESNSSRHQFKSSSDLIRRTSLEKKREKPLSLTERLRKEFGFEDCEEENKAEAKQVLGAQLKSPLPSSSFSSHSTPPPPPPPRPAATSNWNSYDTREADSQSATQQGAILNQSTVPSLPPAEILSNRGVPSRNIPAPSMVPPPTGSLSAPASLAGNHLLNVSCLGQPSPVNGVPPAGSNLLNGPLPRQVSSAAPGLLPPVVAPHLLNGPHPANLLPASLPGPHLNGPHTGLQSQGNGTVLNQHHPPSGIPSQNITRAPHQPPIYQKQQSHPPGNVDHQPHRYPLPPSNVNGGQGVFHSSHNNSGTNFMSSQNNCYPSQTNGEYHHSYNDDSYQGAGSKGSSYRGVSKGMHESPSYRGSKGSRDSSPFYGHGRGSRDSSPHNQSSRDSPSYRGGSKSARDSSPYGYSPSHHKYHSQRRKSKYKSSSSHSSHRYSDSSSRYH